jgi:hypothetical protein
MAENEIIYDHPDREFRSVIENPEAQPLTRDGFEVRFFNADGKKICRRKGNVDKPVEAQQCGLMLDLRTVETLFSEDTNGAPPVVDVYPQAFLRDAGHVQANAVMTGFSDVLREINIDLGIVDISEEPEDEDFDMDDEDDDEDHERPRPRPVSYGMRAVTADSSQVGGKG